jgi:tetratricopeptide (TPR) repeat protein
VKGLQTTSGRGKPKLLKGGLRNQKDETLILLNTGAGKTIIGLLIAQSFVNQGINNVVYVCSTIDLVNQTAGEAEKLGVPVTRRAAGKFDNDLFSQGKAFCITTYPALFYGFRGGNKPGALIFDDAHVASKSIRDAFTLSISKKDHGKLYADVIELLRPGFIDVGQRLELDAAIKDDSTGSVLLAPPCATFDVSDKLTDILNSQISKEDRSLFFPWLFLRDHLKFCATFVGRGTIEIGPPFLPTLTLDAFAKNVKRVYLSATISSKADFTRVFGHKPDKVIAPNVDAGDGERLFVFSSKFKNGEVDPKVVEHMAGLTKVIIAVPSRARGQKNWKFATSPTAEAFSTELDKFRGEKKGAFLLAGRFDGIDLPGSQCRAMVIDGLPSGSNLIELYLFDKLQMDQFHSNTLSVRITQLLGRIIRGRQDFGYFLIADRSVENWLKNERNRALLPELLRKQLYLSEAIEEQISNKFDALSNAEMLMKLINRDAGWIDFYRDNINEMDVPAAKLQENEKSEAILESAGRSEVRFMTKLWDGDIDGAPRELEPVIKEIAIVDPMLAGWYSIWVGLAYYAGGKTDAAIDFFDEARRRIGRALPLPRKKLAEQEEIGPAKTPIEDAIRQIVSYDLVKINDKLAKLRIDAADAFSKTASHKKCEEGVRIVGAALGFTSSRPCTDAGKGPDNLWIDTVRNQMIAFELKTDKSADSSLNKDEIGQGYNHIEWCKTQYPQLSLLGLIYLTDCASVTEKSDPSDEMFFGKQEQLGKVWNEFFGAIDRIKTKSPLERLSEANKIGELSEWTTEGIFERLKGSACKV